MSMVDPDRLSAAYATARCDLLAESATAGHWVGQSSSSPFATAVAISAALTLVERHAPMVAGRFADESRECRLSELIMASVRWLAKRQNADGGWGDTEASTSSVATTLAVRAAFGLTCVPADHAGLPDRADSYLKNQGSLKALAADTTETRRSPRRSWPTALAGLVPWRKVPALPFELASATGGVGKLLNFNGSHATSPVSLAVGLALRASQAVEPSGVLLPAHGGRQSPRPAGRATSGQRQLSRFGADDELHRHEPGQQRPQRSPGRAARRGVSIGDGAA